MPVELVKNPMKAFRIIGDNVYSTVVEQDVNVPDANPDLYKILTSSAKIMIKTCEVMADKVTVNGEIVIDILYSADMEGKPLFSMQTMLDFAQSIDLPGAMPKMKEVANAVVQNIDCMMVNSRKLNIKVIMDINCRVEEVFDINTPSDVRGLPDIQLLREPLSLKQVIGYNKDQYMIKEDIMLPEDKPYFGNLIKVDTRLKGRETELCDGKIEVRGTICADVLYSSDLEEPTLEMAEMEIPFNQYIEIPAAARDMESMVDIMLGDSRVEVKTDEAGDNKVLAMEVDMMVWAKVYSNVEMDIVIDAYSPSNNMDIGKDHFKMHELVSAGHSSMIMKESMGIKEGDPEIEKMCYVDAAPIVNEVKIVDDKIVVEGIIEAKAVYMTSFSGEPMCSMTEQIPFRHAVDAPGARVGMQSGVKTEVESLSHSYMNSQMIELRVVLHTSVEVYKPIEKKMIVKMQEIEGVKVDSSKMPAVTIYLVQKGDSMWTIAKRYNTTVDALVKLNNIENPAKIYPGMQLLILKNIRVG